MKLYKYKYKVQVQVQNALHNIHISYGIHTTYYYSYCAVKCIFTHHILPIPKRTVHVPYTRMNNSFNTIAPWTWTVGHMPTHLLILLSYYLLTNPDCAPTERPAKKAKTVVPKVKFADLREDVRANAIQTMPSKREFGWLRFYRLSPASSFRFLASYTVRPYSLFPVQRDGNLLSLLDCPFDEPVSGARC